MTTWRRPHRTAQQRPRDPYKAAVLAPVIRLPPVLCSCGHVYLAHGYDGVCINAQCGCTSFEEVEGG